MNRMESDYKVVEKMGRMLTLLGILRMDSWGAAYSNDFSYGRVGMMVREKR